MVRRKVTVLGYISLLFLPLPFLLGHPVVWATSESMLFLFVFSWLLPSFFLSFDRSKWRLPLYIYANTDLIVGCEINTKKRTIPAFLCWNRDNKEVASVPSMKDANYKVSWTTKFLKRGEVEIESLFVRNTALFGLIEVKKEIIKKTKRIVFPELGSMKKDFKIKVSEFVEYTNSSSFVGNTDVIRLRPFLHGDSPRDVNWKVSAKVQELVVSVRSNPTVHRVAIVLDTNLKTKAANRFERLVSYCASVLDYCIDNGWFVSLHGDFAGGEEGIYDNRINLMTSLATISSKTDSDYTKYVPKLPTIVLSLYAKTETKDGAMIINYDDISEIVKLSKQRKR